MPAFLPSGAPVLGGFLTCAFMTDTFLGYCRRNPSCRKDTNWKMSNTTRCRMKNSSMLLWSVHLAFSHLEKRHRRLRQSKVIRASRSLTYQYFDLMPDWLLPALAYQRDAVQHNGVDWHAIEQQ